MRTLPFPSRALFSLVLVLALWPVGAGAQNIITTVAGGGSFSGAATSLDLAAPRALAEDAAGNVYIAVGSPSIVLRVDTAGQVSVVAGNGSQGFSGDGGPATSASLNAPLGLVLDSSGNIFIADTFNQRIRRVDSAGIITTVAGNGTAAFAGDNGPATSASLFNPSGVAIDSSGSIFIADTANRRIRRVDAATGIITTVAGTGTAGFLGDGGPAISARFRGPRGVSFDAVGNLFIADTNNNRIREVAAPVTPNSTITTVAGNGTAGFAGDGGLATSAELNLPRGVAFDSQGNMYIPDTNNSVIREVFAVGGSITPQSTIITVAGVGGVFGFSGDNGPATSADLNSPLRVLVDGAGNLLVADTANLRVRQVAAVNGAITSNSIITTVAGGGSGGDNGPATSGILALPVELAFDSAGNLYIGDASNNRIRKVDASGTITTVAGNGTLNFSGDGGLATAAGLCFSQGVAVDSAGNIFIADSCNNRIREVNASSGIITTVVGTGAANYSGDGGPAGQATLNFPEWVAFDSLGNLYIADTFNNVIREVMATSGLITPQSTITTVAGSFAQGGTFSGDGGPATSAGLNGPEGLAIDGAGNLIIADSFNNRVRKVGAINAAITLDSIINTVAGNGTAAFSGDNGPATTASINTPNAVTVDRFGNILIPDSGNNVVRRVDHASGIITTLAGTGVAGFSGDSGPANLAALDQPAGVTLDSSGTFYVADAGNNRVRRFQLSVQLFPTSLDFGTAPPGFTSAPQTVTLTNLSGAPLTFATTNPIAITGMNSADFAETDNCPVSAGLSAGASCTISLTFTPSAIGARTATLTVTDSDPTSPQQVPLAGTGAIVPTVVVTQSRLDFGTVAVGQSASQTVNLANPGNTTLQIFGIALSDVTNFSESDNCNGAVVAGGSCTITVTFSPQQNTPLTATLTIADNAPSSPQVISLSGTGGPGPSVSLSPQSLSFGNQLIGTTSPVQSVTLSNKGSAPLVISSIQVGLGSAQGVWSERAAMPTPRHGAAVGLINGIVYVAGGYSNGALATNEAYNPATDTWTTGLAPMPTPRSASVSTNGAAVNGLLYVIGGNASGFCSSANEAYNPATNTWSILAPMPTPRCHLAVVALNGLIYALGGTDTSGSIAYATVEIYNPAANTWATAAPMPTARDALTAAAVNGLIYAIGGSQVGGPGVFATVEAYDPTANSWTTKTPLPAPTSSLGAGTLNGFVYAVGGSTGPVFLAGNEAYDPATDMWTGVTPMPTARADLGVVVANGAVYAIGGYNGSELPANEAFTPSPDFAVGGDCAQGIQINQGNSCSLTVNFVPTMAGSLAESIVISDNAPGSPHVVSVSGTGVAPAPVASLSTPALNFGPQAVGTTSGAQTLMVINAGTAPLNFGANAVAIAPAGNFALAVEGDGCSFRSVSPGNNCAVFVVFQPQASGPLSATLMFTDNATDSPQMVQLNGQGAAPLVTLSTTSISFGAQLVGTASGAQPIILGNAASATLTIASITPPPGFAETDNCNGSLAARASCVIQVTFAPAAPGSFSGNLLITDNVPGNGQQTVQLSGNSVNFFIAAFPASAQAVAGQSANYSMTVTPARSFSGTVQFNCAGAPTGANCMVTPGAVSLGGGQPGQVMVTVTTTGRGSLGPTQNDWPPMRGIWLQVHLPWLVWLLTLALVVWLVKARKRRLAVVAPAVLLAALLLFSAACGGGGPSSAMPSSSGGPSLTTTPTPPGNYVIVVTASSSGSPTQTLPLTLTVTQ